MKTHDVVKSTMSENFTPRDDLNLNLTKKINNMPYLKVNFIHIGKLGVRPFCYKVLSIWLSVRQFVSLIDSVCHSVLLSVSPSVCLLVCLFDSLLDCLSTSLSVCQFVSVIVSVCYTVYMYASLYVYLPMCLSVSMSI